MYFIAEMCSFIFHSEKVVYRSSSLLGNLETQCIFGSYYFYTINASTNYPGDSACSSNVHHLTHSMTWRFYESTAGIHSVMGRYSANCGYM